VVYFGLETIVSTYYMTREDLNIQMQNSRKKMDSIVDLRQKALKEVVENMASNKVGASGDKFKVVEAEQRESNFQEGFKSLGNKIKIQPLGAIMIVAEDDKHRAEPGKWKDKCKAEEDFDALAAKREVGEIINEVWNETNNKDLATTHSTEPGIARQISGDEEGTAFGSEHFFEDKMKEMMVAMKGHKIKFASTEDCLKKIKEIGDWEHVETPTYKPKEEFTQYMNEQLAFFCQIWSDLELSNEVAKDIKEPVVDDMEAGEGGHGS